MTTPRVAIIGSCVTRDVWNNAGFPDDDRLDLLYVARTSLASLMSRPVAGFEAPATPPGDLSVWETRVMSEDIVKRGLERLIAYQPTHLIIDFIDDRFDLAAVGPEHDPSVFTHSWEFHRSGLGGTDAFAGARRISRHSDEAAALWRDAVVRFADWQATHLPGVRIIFHDARWATRHLDPDRPGRLARFDNDRELWSDLPAPIDAHNRVLEDYSRHFRAVFPKARVVRAAPWLRFGDPRHRWGLSPFHFVGAYYRDVWRQFRRLGCDRRRRGAAKAA